MAWTVVVAAALWMIFGNTFLPMNDAPSHIANAVIAHKLRAGDSFFAAHYHFELIPVPYWATALLLVAGLPIVSPLLLWKLLISLYAVLLPLSCLVLARAASAPELHAEKSLPDAAPLLPLLTLTVFHWGYWMGESNYLLGQPVALLALALLLRSERLRSGSFFGFVLLAALSYVCHIYALTMLLIGATAWALVALLAHRLPELSFRKLRAPHVIGLLWIYALFAVAAYFVLFHHGTGANRGSLGFDLSPRRLVHMLIDPFDSPAPPPRWVLGLLYLAVIALFGWAHRATLQTLFQQRQTEKESDPLSRLHQLVMLLNPALLVPGLTLLFAAYLGPVAIFAPDGTQKEGEIAIRFVLGGFLLLAMSLRWPKLTQLRSPRGTLLLVMTLFSVVQLVSIHQLHRSIDAKLTRIDRTLLAQIPTHSRLLPLLDLPTAEWTDYLIHRVGNYAVLRDSYSPHIFAVRGQHPLRHLPWGDQREVANLKVTDDEWRFYDYVLLQHGDRPLPPALAAHLDPIAREDDFLLLRVRK